LLLQCLAGWLFMVCWPPPQWIDYRLNGPCIDKSAYTGAYVEFPTV
jgi:hypothetical protein